MNVLGPIEFGDNPRNDFVQSSGDGFDLDLERASRKEET